ncbi:glycogen debranching enzyme [Agrilus planipennis]|uniref:Glycogen debranching enzyme n=1 Tax=Agrilus planipennis TaxID=224129 RepID=A0A7F5REE3_AGRPL|nr:glycogen debranching enzyme [Agrilus planipennis]
MPKLSGNYYILIENSENSTNNSVDDVCATNKTTVLVYILSLCKKVHNVIVSPVVSVSLWCIKKVIIISQFLRHVSRSREIQGEKKGKPSTSKELEEEAAENVIQNKESVSEIAVEPGKSYSEEENESSSDEFTQLDVEDLSRPDDTTDDIEIISPVVVELASNKKAVENILAEEAKDLSENLVPKQLENKLSDSKIFVNDDFKYFGDNEQNNLKPMNFLSKQEQGASPSTEDIIKNTLNKSSSGKSIIEHFQQSKAHTQPPLNDDSSQTTNVKEINKLSKEITEQVVTKAVSLVEENMGMKSQVRVLTLNDKEHQDSVLYRLEKNWTLQFRLGPSLLGRKILLYCNYPEEGAEFKRNSYQLLPWSEDEGCEHSDDTALQIQIQVKKAGSYHYYFTYEDIESSTPQGSGFFIVDPILTYGDNEILPLDCIQCQTVLAKSLGPFSTWENKLKVAKESGYNMIHFTPIQALGDSNSSYSLKAQLQLNPIFDNNKKTTFKDIETFTSKLRKEWKMLSICDIVLNHTANETKWLEEHPETTYNCSNCPYLRPAYLLDAALHQFTLDVQKGLYENRGIPTEIYSEDHLNAVRHALYTNVLPQINLQDLYICNVNKLVAEFLDYARNKVPPISETRNPVEELKLVQDPLYRRLESTVSMDTALRIYNVFRQDCFDEDCRLKKCGEELKNKLDQLNAAVIGELNDHISAAIENTIAGMRYFRVQSDGPKIRDVSEKNPLAFRYFTDFGKPASIKEHEEIMYGTNSKYLMAHNGWVMDSEPLRNFAAPDSNVYIRRELIAWGDSVKLRYGEKPEDCPFLWNHMKEYVELTAKIFDGVRLDNCHSTPIPIAEYLLDCARKVRPNLYVVAELFTNSDQKDNIFVNRLGISSLIREAMSAWDSHEEGRLVYRYGGYPVGAFIQPHIRPLVPAIAHALFLDLTHDNPSPVEKRSVFDLLPSTALVNMACCASGSNRGYDELVPHHIHVVDEDRQYTEWTDDSSLTSKGSQYVSSSSGLIAVKRIIHDLHYNLGKNGYNQVFVDQMDSDIVAVTRHNPLTHESVILVAFTAFGHPPLDAANYQRQIKPLRVEGILNEIILEATLNHISVKSGGSKYTKEENFEKDPKCINGLSNYYVDMRSHITLPQSEFLQSADSGNPNIIQLNFKNFKPGSIVAIKISLHEEVAESVKKTRNLLNFFSKAKDNELKQIISKMNLNDLNRALYHCDQEEKDEGNGFGVYDIPGFGPMVYCGFQGLISLLSKIRPFNDLGHPMCGNLRAGNWMIDYVWQRLKFGEGTNELGVWIQENIKPLKDIPRYLIPCYFDAFVTGLYMLLLDQSFTLMSNFITYGSTFVKGLALGSVQCVSYCKSANLPPFSPNLSPPLPPKIRTNEGKEVQACTTLAAGLPHFSTGYMRSWGRDTFIALRGLLLLTGRHEEARFHILGYAACLRHGLIPNLLDSGNPRYNCRDAVWWWLHCIKSYVEEVSNGVEILSDTVSRLFPTDSSARQEPGVADQPLHVVMQEALKVHFQGLVFRERNAGRQIDAHMSDRGFNNQIGVHPETGFVFGGNESNCGTWMDKMGSSDKAGNRGKPATPRDGSAVELVGLSKSVVTWLDKLYHAKKYPYDGVERIHKNGNVTKWTFRQWADKIQTNFEKYFWVNMSPVAGENRPDLINKRGIYKDSHGASQEYADFQLRCNFPITMVVAPELFDSKRAWTALQKVEKYLLGPLGLKTLDPEDWSYNGIYDNSNDSEDYNTAHGFNYHQGPEWVWPMGFYLRAKLHFAAENGDLRRTIANTKVVLSRHFTELQTSVWRGLSELTNANGTFCHGSCATQAWSMACILEVSL